MMTNLSPEDKNLLDANIQKTVGLSALRKIRHLVDESTSDDKSKAVLVRRISYLVGFAVLLSLLIFLVSPKSIIATLRIVSAIAR